MARKSTDHLSKSTCSRRVRATRHVYDPGPHGSCGGAGRATCRRPPPARGRGRARVARIRAVPALVARPRSAIDTKQYLYLDPGRLLGARAVPVGSARRLRAPCRTRTSATCSRWGRTTGSWTRSACPTGWRSVCGSARSRSPPRSALAGCSSCSARDASVHSQATLVYMLTPYQLAFTARFSVLLLAVGGASLARRAHHAGGPRRRLARSTADRAHRPHDRRRQRVVAAVRPDRAGAVARDVRLRRAAGGRRCGPRGGADRGPHTRCLALVDRRAADAGRVRVARAPAHRVASDRGEVLHTDRHPAGHRQLDLLRPRRGRRLDRPGRRLPPRRDRGVRDLRHPRSRRSPPPGCCAGATVRTSSCSSWSAR